MRRWSIRLAILLTLLAGAFFLFGPGLIERSMNKVDGLPLPKVSSHAIALHKTLTIVDLHSDTLLMEPRPYQIRGSRPCRFATP